MRLLNSILLLVAAVHAGPRVLEPWQSWQAPTSSNQEGSGSSASDVSLGEESEEVGDNESIEDNVEVDFSPIVDSNSQIGGRFVDQNALDKSKCAVCNTISHVINAEHSFSNCVQGLKFTPAMVEKDENGFESEVCVTEYGYEGSSLPFYTDQVDSNVFWSFMSHKL